MLQLLSVCSWHEIWIQYPESRRLSSQPFYHSSSEFCSFQQLLCLGSILETISIALSRPLSSLTTNSSRRQLSYHPTPYTMRLLLTFIGLARQSKCTLTMVYPCMLWQWLLLIMNQVPVNLFMANHRLMQWTTTMVPDSPIAHWHDHRPLFH